MESFETVNAHGKGERIHQCAWSAVLGLSIASVMSLIVGAHAAAGAAPYVVRSGVYSADLVRAMDPCLPGAGPLQDIVTPGINGICDTPAAPGDVQVIPGGTIAGRMTLADCLANNGLPASLAQRNVEVVDSALVNCDTGKIIARPGILN